MAKIEWWRRAALWIRPQDVVWLLLFSGMIVFNQTGEPSEIAMLVALAAVQILESKLPFLSSQRGIVSWILLKLLLSYLLIGYTDGVSSSYYWLLLLPMISAGSSLGVLGTLVVTLLAWCVYLSFLLRIDWNRFYIEAPERRELVLRVIFLAVAGNLTNTLAEALRRQFNKTKAVADQLAEANRSLQQARKPCAAPTGWRRSGSLRRAWRTNCAIP